MPINISKNLNIDFTQGLLTNATLNNGVLQLQQLSGSIGYSDDLTSTSLTHTIQSLSVYAGTSTALSNNIITQTTYGDNNSLVLSGFTGNQGFCSIDFGTAKKITKIVLKMFVGPTTETTMYIKNFKIQANNTSGVNGASWVDIYQGVTTGHSGGAVDTFIFENNTAYQYYRIFVIDNWGYGGYVALSEWEMMENITSNVYANGGSFESNVIDMTQFFQNVTTIDNTITNDSDSSITIMTSTSNDNVTFTPYVVLNVDNTIASSQGRYLKIKVVLTPGTTQATNVKNDFLSAESTQFNSDSKVIFDGSLYLNTVYQNEMTQDTSWSESGKLFKNVIDKSDFKSIEKIEVI